MVRDTREGRHNGGGLAHWLLRVCGPKASPDRGAVVVIVAVLMVALLGMTALVFDLGNAWGNRRDLITTTDSGALAAAGVFAVGGDGCVEAANFVAGNDADATMNPGWCAHVGSGSYGVVTVETAKFVEYAFAPVLGIDNVTIEARTMAAYGVPATVEGGLRPFGLCIDAMSEFPQWSLPLTGAGTGMLRVPYGKDDQPEACNGDQNIPGNWGLMDFDGGSNPLGDTRDWLRNGYDGPVPKGTRLLTCEDEPDPEVCVDGDPGAWSNSLGNELDYLIDEEIVFTLPLFDSGGGNGSNAYFHIVGYVTAQLYGYKANGSADSRYLDIGFTPGVSPGELGDGSGLDTGTRVITICGVETASGC